MKPLYNRACTSTSLDTVQPWFSTPDSTYNLQDMVKRILEIVKGLALKLFQSICLYKLIQYVPQYNGQDISKFQDNMDLKLSLEITKPDPVCFLAQFGRIKHVPLSGCTDISKKLKLWVPYWC